VLALALAAVLAVVMGATLGLLGGGGSILTVPILVYALGVETKAAVATSLLVVGTTSAVGVVQHARAGHVRWRDGLVFGAVAMVGAYGGGVVARWVPGSLLLIAFAALMVVTAIAMLRKGEGLEEERPRDRSVRATLLLAIEGLAVGAVTGLVGAGGGFLIVPALAVLGGLGLRAAMGTSLLVIAMNSFAGLLGQLSHVSIDLRLAALVCGFSVAGVLAGGVLSRRVEPRRLRRAFAWFVLAMAAFVLSRQISREAAHAIFVERWPFWVGGLAIGGFVVTFLVVANRMLGVSTGFEDAGAALVDPKARRSWRLPFVGGIALGGLLSALLSGGGHATFAMGRFDTALTASLPAKAALFLLGGVLIGYGTRMAGGCTSGHGIVGTAQMARSSWLATATFMLTGFIVANVLLRVIGG
jgi:uncharacterized protein